MFCWMFLIFSYKYLLALNHNSIWNLVNGLTFEICDEDADGILNGFIILLCLSLSLKLDIDTGG